MNQSLRKILADVTRKNLPVVLLMALAIVLSAAAALMPPLVLERIVDQLTARQDVPMDLVILYFLWIVGANLLESAQSATITIYGQKISHAIRSGMADKLSRLSAAWYATHATGEVTSRFVNDVDTINALFDEGIISIAADALKIVSILFVVFTKSRGLGILLVLLIPWIYALTRAFQKRMLSAQSDQRKAVGKVNAFVPETIRNIRMIHTLQKEPYMEDRYSEGVAEICAAMSRSSFYDSIYSPIILMISSLVIAFMMGISVQGAQFQAFFGLTVGSAVAIVAYVGNIFGPIETIGMEIQNIQSAAAGIRRINEFLDEPEWQPAVHEPQDSEALITFDHVVFGYEKDRSVLQDLSFAIRAGESVTFVGRTGAGKSTIFKLIEGLYEPQSGRVLLNGQDTTGLQPAGRRALIGPVEQSFKAVTGTVRDQITMHDPAITDEMVIRAARMTGLHEAILQLPEGYDTAYGEASFSQGQIQLLSIARAVASQPQILLLDEITANLDSATEQSVLAALKEAIHGRTVLSISHRLQETIGSERVITISSDAS